MVFFIVIIAVLGAIFSCKNIEAIYRKKDPPQVVIDEFIGMFIALAFIPPTSLNVILAFFAFRVFDVIKPAPIRRIERINSPYAIILDDVIAALYANISVQIIARIIS